MVHAIISIHKPVARTCHMSPWNHLGTGRWGTAFQDESSYGWEQEVHTGAGWVTITRLLFGPSQSSSSWVTWDPLTSGPHLHLADSPFLQAVFCVQLPPDFLFSPRPPWGETPVVLTSFLNILLGNLSEIWFEQDGPVRDNLEYKKVGSRKKVKQMAKKQRLEGWWRQKAD